MSFTLTGTATEGTDYVAVTKTVTIPAGATSVTFVADPIDDQVFEGAETVVATLASASTNGVALGFNPGQTTATGSIDDTNGPGSDKPVIGITVAPASVAEDGAANLIYTVAITNGKTSAFATSVTFTLTGTATEGTDYAALTKTVTIPAGQTSVSFIVNPTTDTLTEGNETVVATLTGATTNGVVLAISPGLAAATGTIVDDDTPPTLTLSGNAAVSEEALPGGIPTAGTTPVSTFTGTFSVTDPEGGPFTLQAALPTQAYKSGGVDVVWTSINNGLTLEGRTGPGAAGLVATLNLLPAQSQYQFTLFKPLDDFNAAGAPVDSLTYTFSLTATDPGGHVSTPAILSVAIADDTPGVATPLALVAPVTGVDTNVMFVLDISGSMATRDTGLPGNPTRLEAAIQSVSRLINRYDELGDVRVRLVTFSTHANGLGDTWLTVGAARALLATLTASGGTNYDEALGDAINLYGAAGKLATTATQNVSYFLSDGQPTYAAGTVETLVPPGTQPADSPPLVGTGQPGQTNADLGIQAAEEAAWKSFLVTNKINSFALGFGGLTATDTAALNPIAYNGRANEEENALVVQSFADLDRALADSIRPSVDGNLLTGSVTAGPGADGPAFVKQLTIDGVTYTYDPANGGSIAVTGGTTHGVFDTATNSLTVTTALNSKIVVDMDDGGFTYTVAPSSSLPPNGLQEVFGFQISDQDGDTVASSLTVTVPNPFVRGTEGADTLNGRETDDIMIGNAGNDTLNGLGGNDDLYGDTDNDTLNGGAGNDRLYGGSGNDSLTGGVGSDVFAWRFGDQGTATTTGRAVDTITDFNVGSIASGGDVLDLRDLLQGELNTPAGTTGVGNLLNYLDITTSTAGGVTSTEIRVSATGGFTNGNYSAGQETQHITLTGVNLSTQLVAGSTLTEAQIIQNLLQNGKLITD